MQISSPLPRPAPPIGVLGGAFRQAAQVRPRRLQSRDRQLGGTAASDLPLPLASRSIWHFPVAAAHCSVSCLVQGEGRGNAGGGFFRCAVVLGVGGRKCCQLPFCGVFVPAFPAFCREAPSCNRRRALGEVIQDCREDAAKGDRI